MSSQLNEIADIPREFLREGTQFMNRCAKRTLVGIGCIDAGGMND